MSGEHKISSIEEVDTDRIKPDALHILKEALNDSRCSVSASNDGCLKIIVAVPSIADQGNKKQTLENGLSWPVKDYYGLYISVHGKVYSGNEAYVWLAENRGGDIMDDISAGEYPLTMSLDEIITNASNELNRCDFCKKIVGLKNLKRIAFANKSCPDCEKNARKNMEYSGWCD